MDTPRFTVLRFLGILVGSIFVISAPFIASDKGLLSLDGMSYLLVSVTLGLVFIAYGFLGTSRLPKVPLRLNYIPEAALAIFYLVFGSFLLLDSGRAALSRVSGAILILFAVIAIKSAYAKRRSKPAA